MVCAPRRHGASVARRRVRMIMATHAMSLTSVARKCARGKT
jgi:hypothetical protein